MIPNQEQVFSALRTLFAYGMGLAVAHGYLTENTATQLIGAAGVLVPLIWGMWAQSNANKVLSAAAVDGVEKIKLKADAAPSLVAVAADPAQPKVEQTK